MKTQLTPEAVRKSCDTSIVTNFITTQKETTNGIIGQNRATRALQFGLGIWAEGFNIYVSGTDGTGKLTAVKKFIEEPASKEPVPSDWCYVHNFKDAYQPAHLQLPAGRAKEFKQDVHDLIAEARSTLIKAFEHDDFIKRKQAIADTLEQKQDKLFDDLSERAAEDSIMIEETPGNIMTVPMRNGKRMSDEQFNKLSEEQQAQIRKLQEKYVDQIKSVLREARQQEREANAELIKLEKEVASFAINSLIEEVEEKYATVPDVIKHLAAIREDILGNLAAFLRHERPGPEVIIGGIQESSFTKRYEVNVLVDNSALKGAPVVVELNPTYNNLTGRVEKESMMGGWITDHTLIRKGSLHAANGGFLIIRVEDLFKNAFSWESLKRALKNKEAVIEEAGDQWGLFTTKTLKPASIPLKIKVVLIGNPLFYTLLYTYDPDFRELFKVKADFDTSMERTESNLGDYVNFCFTVCKKENLAPLNATAIVKIIEYGSRLAEDQNKLSTRFSDIADVVREANHYAKLEQAVEINTVHIQKAIEERKYRSSLIQEKLNEMFSRNQILIDTSGKKVGQVNGLTVISLGDIEFGIPARITCSTSLGKEGIVAIEREAELSGPIHTKGVMILGGYLSEKFVQEKPISLGARIVFEQSYGEIDGDSASSSELYALLSSLSDVPIKQGIAVTGSVNQKGQVQAIGGVNEKIEGYYEICKRLGWNQEQGVIIPSSNVQNLMLKEEVQEAVRQGRFKIWAIDSIDEGIEILTNYKYGSPNESGTISYLVNKKLNEYATRMRAFAMTEEEEQD